MTELGLLSGFVGFLFFCAVLVRWNERMLGSKGSPAGAIGWPLIGETIGFLLQGHDFMKIRRLRYGNLFKTHVMGSPLVVSMDPDVNRTIFLKTDKAVATGNPRSMMEMAGKHSPLLLHGPLHKYVRGVVLSLVGPHAMKESLLPKLDSFMQSYLHGLDGQIVDIQELTKKMIILIPLKFIAGIETGKVRDTLLQEFPILVSGSFCLPFNIPGLTCHRALQARKKIVSIFGDLLRERRRSSSAKSDDMLSSLIHSDHKMNCQLTDEHIIDLCVALVFAGYDTASTASMMALLYLYDHPRVLHEIREEHLKIRKTKSTGEAITWDDYKSMNFTRSVILETMRMAAIVPGVLKKTTEDVEINGFSVPQGWRIYVCMRESYYDPTHYPEPLQFNPWRWQETSLETHSRFLMFGGGLRQCPGKEISILQISSFLHYFLTRYRWEPIGERKIQAFPKINAPKGLPCRVWHV